jgi:hypothetical protein
MKSLWRKFAAAGILWAILMPLLLIRQEIRDGQSVKLHLMAENLQLANDSATNGIVSISTNGTSNWAGVVHGLATTEDRRTNIFASVTVVSSVVILVLSACALKSRRDN